GVRARELDLEHRAASGEDLVVGGADAHRLVAVPDDDVREDYLEGQSEYREGREVQREVLEIPQEHLADRLPDDREIVLVDADLDQVARDPGLRRLDLPLRGEVLERDEREDSEDRA